MWSPKDLCVRREDSLGAEVFPEAFPLGWKAALMETAGPGGGELPSACCHSEPLHPLPRVPIG
jgi:hypothetical protein